MNPRLFLRSRLSVPAEFRFGFDTVVMSGAEETIPMLCGSGSGVPAELCTLAFFLIPGNRRWLFSRDGDRAVDLTGLNRVWVKSMLPETQGGLLAAMPESLFIQ